MILERVTLTTSSIYFLPFHSGKYHPSQSTSSFLNQWSNFGRRLPEMGKTLKLPNPLYFM